jgi:hypothetical protein
LEKNWSWVQTFDLVLYKILKSSRSRSIYARNFTYSTVSSYVVDIFAFHDSPLHNQPNAVMHAEDGLCQPNCGSDGHEDDILLFLPEKKCDEGHFVILSHPGDIFVDDNDWNVECLIDLEWGLFPSDRDVASSFVAGKPTRRWKRRDHVRGDPPRIQRCLGGRITTAAAAATTTTEKIPCRPQARDPHPYFHPY